MEQTDRQADGSRCSEMPPWGGGITAVLTTVDECVLGLEASFLLVLIRVEADDEDAVHRDEQGCSMDAWV